MFEGSFVHLGFLNWTTCSKVESFGEEYDALSVYGLAACMLECVKGVAIMCSDLLAGLPQKCPIKY